MIMYADDAQPGKTTRTADEAINDVCDESEEGCETFRMFVVKPLRHLLVNTSHEGSVMRDKGICRGPIEYRLILRAIDEIDGKQVLSLMVDM